MSLTAMTAPTLPIVRAKAECLKQFKPLVSLGIHSQFISNGRRHLICRLVQEKRASIIHVAALKARCATRTQRQTLTRKNPTITYTLGNDKFPDLDDGDIGFPPRGGMCGGKDGGKGRGGGGGGGGGGHWTGEGGEGHWAGGLFLFLFLLILGFLKDKEKEGPYGDERKRKATKNTIS
ncbi:protein YELLOW LEAF 1, choloroplastic-like [Lycium ferocissimum]|uniref:protein YELLOW LEAF 1, choloroplastic-like n=1 Tax=Lycium ferocissimum TaxID=112874 RepID=UPI002814BA35|nr:protein YELLOW LEAF 1, choloroplastic-like [Lycium ferocissimum]